MLVKRLDPTVVERDLITLPKDRLKNQRTGVSGLIKRCDDVLTRKICVQSSTVSGGVFRSHREVIGCPPRIEGQNRNLLERDGLGALVEKDVINESGHEWGRNFTTTTEFSPFVGRESKNRRDSSEVYPPDYDLILLLRGHFQRFILRESQRSS